ncbi:choline transporter [Dongshaea marina]|uniref:choline transporter n=1 Tax=Dongshaea marina TaxID=2047966 RepID=UPI000D3ED4BD|nr:choline transporter [Dongshaea marina]
MTAWLSAGMIFTYVAIAIILFKWGNLRCIGVTPVKTFSFISILFTSGLDAGLIMLPLTEFSRYTDLSTYPGFSFTNPLAIEFGFWGGLIWGFYFLTCFYFCVIEPRVKFFEIPLVKFINNIVIIGTCAFTAYLLLFNLPWYLPQMGDGKTVIGSFYLIVFLVISISVYSSTSLRYVRVLSLGTTWLFIALIGLIWLGAFAHPSGLSEFFSTFLLLGGYFSHLDKFLLPVNSYHAFYLFWWLSWSIMIGQFTSRFVGGLRTWQVFLVMLIFPSIPIAIWFTTLYFYYSHGLNVSGFYSLIMAVVGITFVINSLDSLVRLYTDNIGMTVSRLGKVKYILGNIVVLSLLTLLFKLDFLRIQWVGTLVIGLFFACVGYIVIIKYQEIKSIQASPEGNRVDYSKFELE